MALYNQGVFVLLIAQMLLFVVLILPLPFGWRRKLFKFLAESPAIARLIYGLKITFIFVSLLFIDALQHMVKVQKEGRTGRQTCVNCSLHIIMPSKRQRGSRADGRSETDWRSRKFLSERNMYLTGFTLFLSLILNRTYNLIYELIKTQDQLAETKKQIPGTGKSPSDVKLKALQKDYDDLSAKYNALEAKSGSKKSN